MKVKGLRWWIIALVTVGTITNYLSRSALGIAAPTLIKELGITQQQYSYVVSAFQATYALAAPVVGYVIDIIGVKRGIAIFAIGWSVANMAHGTAGGWQSLAFWRGTMGVTESSANPAGMKVVAEWFPAKERGLACGIYSMGTSLGAMLAPPLVVWAILEYNWEMSFIITGAVGLIWVVLWLFFYQSPEKNPALSDEERILIADGQVKSTENVQRVKLKDMLTNRNLWGISLPRFMADPAWGTLHYWMPLYLVTERHLDMAHVAMFTWLPFLTSDLGCIFSGIMARYLNNRGITIINSRRITYTFAACLMVSMAFICHVENIYLAVALFCIAGFAHQCLSITVITMSSDLFNKSEVATATGFAALSGGTGNFLFSMFLGASVAVIGYNFFFVGLGFFDLIGAAFLWTLVKEKKTHNTTQQTAFI
ncbi:MFS transporter [Hafnia alvei]|uniref:MFS transporter, ACS family, hexuronate transporter n=1 Tax=Hafnia alvei TaxID=569 RepID=A0A1C6Z2H8_HAFAL|nr:MFS transporter [Hafnia alvei]NLS52559.1 MFS transporter [Hafnia alvei]SCM53362.1 MFS transporter, ACS family, hexuronate transporter [Hafnia alvei]